MCLLTAGTHILPWNYGVKYFSPNPKQIFQIVICSALKSKYIKSRTFNDKNRWIIKKVVVLKKLLPHLATRGTYSPGDWRCDEAWREQTLVHPPVMCQQRLIYCTWELSIMKNTQGRISHLTCSARKSQAWSNPITLSLDRSTNHTWSRADCDKLKAETT